MPSCNDTKTICSLRPISVFSSSSSSFTSTPPQRSPSATVSAALNTRQIRVPSSNNTKTFYRLLLLLVLLPFSFSSSLSLLPVPFTPDIPFPESPTPPPHHHASQHGRRGSRSTLSQHLMNSRQQAPKKPQARRFSSPPSFLTRSKPHTRCDNPKQRGMALTNPRYCVFCL